MEASRKSASARSSASQERAEPPIAQVMFTITLSSDTAAPTSSSVNWQVLSRRGAAPGGGPALLGRVRAAAGATWTTSPACWPTTSATSPTAFTTTRRRPRNGREPTGSRPGLSSPLHPWSPPALERSRGDLAHRAWCAEIDGSTAAAMAAGLPRRSRRSACGSRSLLEVLWSQASTGMPRRGGGRCTASRPLRAAVGHIVYGRDARSSRRRGGGRSVESAEPSVPGTALGRVVRARRQRGARAVAQSHRALARQKEQGRPHDRAVQERPRHVHQQRNITRRRLARLALVTHSRALHSYAPRNSNTRRDGLYSARRSSEATPWPAPYPRQGPGGPSPLCGERKRPPRT